MSTKSAHGTAQNGLVMGINISTLNGINPFMGRACLIDFCYSPSPASHRSRRRRAVKGIVEYRSARRREDMPRKPLYGEIAGVIEAGRRREYKINQGYGLRTHKGRVHGRIVIPLSLFPPLGGRKGGIFPAGI